MSNKFMSKVKALCKKAKDTLEAKTAVMKANAHTTFVGTVAEAYVDTGVKILIAVVIGALLLACLYTLFNTTIMPTVSDKITELFGYNG